VLETHYTFADEWLRLRTDQCERADGHVIEAYHVLEYPPWVNIVAITAGDRVVFVREYRHGAGRVLLGLPSGVAREDETGFAAAARELSEETGFQAAQVKSLGTYFANPATQSNLVSSFIALDVQPTEKRQLDPNEEIESGTLPFVEYLQRSWSHSPEYQGLHLAALHLATGYILRSRVPRLASLRKALLELA